MSKKNRESCKGGLLNIWKPAGITSMQVVRQVKTLSQESRVGHVGTLDPFADGVLPVAIGKSTNMIKYMDDYNKTYRVMINLGESTTTQDLSGEVVKNDKLSLKDLEYFGLNNFEKIKSEAEKLTGKITQAVPLYSAVKLDGKPMYWYARNEIEVPVKTRAAYIYEANFIAAGVNPRVLDVENSKDVEQLDGEQHDGEQLKLAQETKGNFTWEAFERLCPEQAQARKDYFPGLDQSFSDLDTAKYVNLPRAWAIFDLTVSSGTYVRTWAEDLAKICGLSAYAFSLRRLANGPYKLEDSIKLEGLENIVEASDLQDFDNSELLLSPATARPDYPVLNLEYQDAVKLLQGQKVNAKKYLKSQEFHTDNYFRLFFAEKFIGLAKIIETDRGKALTAERMFTEVESFKSRFK